MRVGIHEARRQDQAVGVEHPLRRLAVRLAEGLDDAVLDPEIPHEARRARPVADARVLDQQVQHEGSPFLGPAVHSVVGSGFHPVAAPKHGQSRRPGQGLPQTCTDGRGECREIGETMLYEILRDLEVHAAVAVDDDIPESGYSPH